MTKVAFLFVLMCIAGSAVAQPFTVQGKIIAESDKTSLAGARVVLSRIPDSTNKFGAISDANGLFKVSNIPAGKYSVRVNFIGYKGTLNFIDLAGNLNLGTIALKEGETTADEIVVEERLLTAVQLGDTVQFNAKAFKVNPDATAEDLITKMPTITMQGGRIQAQGEQVRQVLVDGKPFFGEDPSAVLKNLPAEMIDKIQVFDQQSEQSRFSGVEDGNTTKTINIITKPAYRNGSFGRAFAGYGENQSYKSGGNLNIFNDERRISIIGQSNNINEQNFSSEDLLGVASSGGQGGGRRGGGFGGGGAGGFGGGGFAGRPPGGAFNANPTDNFLVSQQNGLITTHALGGNYSDNWGKTTEVAGSYFFNQSDNRARTSLLRQFILPSQSGQTYSETNFSDARNSNHRGNFRLDHQFDEANSLLINPRLTVQRNRGDNNLLGTTASLASPLGNTQNDFFSDLSAIRFSNQLLYRHRFSLGRTLSLSVNTNYNQSDGESNLDAVNQFFQSPNQIGARADSINQFSNIRQRGWTWAGNATYTEPLAQAQALQFSYTANYRPNSGNNETFSRQPLTNRFVLDTALTNRLESAYLTQAATAGYRFFNRDVILSLNIGYQWANLNSKQEFPFAFGLGRAFQNVIPSMFFRLRFSENQNLFAFYRTNTAEPNVTQLQEVLNNANPLLLSIGNQSLNQEFQHNFTFRYSSVDVQNASSFFFLISGNLRQDYIGNSVIIAARDTTVGNGIRLRAGSQLSQPINLNGFYSVRGLVSYGVPLSFIQTNLNLSLSANLTRTPALLNGAENIATAPSITAGITFSSNISDKLDFTISSNTNVGSSQNSLQLQLNNQFISQQSRVRFNWIFGDGFVVQTDLAHQYFTGLTEGFNQNFLLWNASVGKKLFDNRVEVRLTVFDILKQNNSIQRSFTETFIEDTRTDILQRYAILTFTYNLRAN